MCNHGYFFLKVPPAVPKSDAHNSCVASSRIQLDPTPVGVRHSTGCCCCCVLALPLLMADEEDEPGFEEELDDGSGGVDAAGHGRRKRLFSKELRCMMYGFGDDQNPYTESVDILEDLVIEFITEMTHKAMSIGRQGRVQVEDIVFLIRKDPRKFARVKDLLTMNEELKRARKAFDEANYGS
ncbi:Transcription initiation factor TFIID subunit 13 [Ilyodon furcidens]|uniref:Transcription initiation factor TFIID subunit 13 n=3 Tax=Goodeidae TaxID=28758 RepID=A0ABV0UQF3_9TELE